MATQQHEVHFHRISERTPGWVWQALYVAQKDAPAGSLPVIIVDQQPHPFVIIAVEDYNRLVAGEKGGRNE